MLKRKKEIEVEKIPQILLMSEVKDLITRNQFQEIIQYTNQLLIDNASLKFRTEQLTNWLVQLEKKIIGTTMLKRQEDGNEEVVIM